MLTRDEERALPAALASLPAGTGILVLDARSSDRTREIARGAGATVVERDWTDFVEARRFALSLVRTPWTFMLDADERFDERMRAALQELEPPARVDGYCVRRVTLFCGAQLRALGWDEERLLRLFRTARATVRAHPAAGGTAAVHERWSVAGEVEDLEGTLVHDSYPDRASYRRKFARYTSLEAQGLRTNPLRLALVALEAPARLVWMLLARGGLRAGWRGTYLSFWSALYPLVAHAKAFGRPWR
ncbi:MAG: glycosyltransferase family 2 protein [Candidatus Eremiobacteraeota bacterium]|nr:glycosyltransferase family 2 protein [Candidatus Eremiobacteraeota bacterium]